MVVHSWSKTEFQVEDPDPYPITNRGQTRHARGPVHVQFRYMFTFFEFSKYFWIICVIICLINDTRTSTRAVTSGRLIEVGVSTCSKNSFYNDGVKAWNKAPDSIKNCESIWSAKKEIKLFVKKSTCLKRLLISRSSI